MRIFDVSNVRMLDVPLIEDSMALEIACIHCCNNQLSHSDRLPRRGSRFTRMVEGQRHTFISASEVAWYSLLPCVGVTISNAACQLGHCYGGFTATCEKSSNQLTEAPVCPSAFPHASKLQINSSMRSLGSVQVGIAVLKISLCPLLLSLGCPSLGVFPSRLDKLHVFGDMW